VVVTATRESGLSEKAVAVRRVVPDRDVCGRGHEVKQCPEHRQPHAGEAEADQILDGSVPWVMKRGGFHCDIGTYGDQRPLARWK